MTIGGQVHASSPRGSQRLPPQEPKDRHLKIIKDLGEDTANVFAGERSAVPDYRIPPDRLAELSVPIRALGLEVGEEEVKKAGAKLRITRLDSDEHEDGARLLYFSAEIMQALGSAGTANVGLHFEPETRLVVVSDAELALDFKMMLATWERHCHVATTALTWPEFRQLMLNHSPEEVAEFLRLNEPAPARPVIVISCSKETRGADRFELFKNHLKPLERNARAVIWCGSEPGQDTQKAFEAAISRAALAVVLVTQDYLNQHEKDQLEPILAKHERHEMILFWIPIRPVNTEFSALAAIEPATDKPLNSLSKSRREEVVTAIVRRISQEIEGR